MAEKEYSIPAQRGEVSELAVAAAARDLEGDICDAVRLTSIAERIVDHALDRRQGKSFGGDGSYLTFTLSMTQLEDIIFIVSEAQFRVRKLSESYFAALEGRA